MAKHSYDEIVRNTVPGLDMFGRPAPKAPASNRELAARVRTALRADPRLTDAPIEVSANGGCVWLSGTVLGPGMVAYAAAVARQVEGVVEVFNELAVDPDA